MHYQSYKRKAIHRFIISQHSVLAHVSLNIKMAADVKKRISVKGKNVSKSNRYCSYDLYFKTVVIKYRTDNCEAARKYVS